MSTGKDFEYIEIKPGDLDDLIQENRRKSESVMEKQKLATETARKILGYPGACFGSKSWYSNKYPENLIVFNANICTEKGKIWYGDYDVTKEEQKLKELAKEIGEKIYLLYEMDARFENEEKPKIERAVYSTDGDMSVTSEYYERRRGKIKRKDD